MITKAILTTWLTLSATLGTTWDKTPEKWNLSDVYRILQDSPWSPAAFKLEGKIAPGQVDSQTGLVPDSRSNRTDANTVPGMRMSRSKPQAAIPVLWWSSKTIRLAEQRLRQLRNPALPAGSLQADELPDYVLVIEGSEQLRILRDAKEDLHDTVFLELPDGVTLDLGSVQFVEGTEQEEPRVEFHFAKQIEGRPTLDPNFERVIFHCKASSKTARPFQDNAITLRADFKPRVMRVRGLPIFEARVVSVPLGTCSFLRRDCGVYSQVVADILQENLVGSVKRLDFDEVPQTTIRSEAEALWRSRHNPALHAAVDHNISENFSNRSVMQCRGFQCRRLYASKYTSSESFQLFVELELQIPPQHTGSHSGGLSVRNRKDRDDCV